VDAVVMAAGEGRRLRPLTDRWPKPLLPVGGRPVIATLVRELAATGFDRATIVTGHLAERVEALLGDGSGFGLTLRYARQPEPVGSADAIRVAVARGAQPPLLVTAADTVFAPGALRAAVERWEADGAAGAIGVRRAEVDERPDRPRIKVEEGRVTRVVLTGESAFVSQPVWILDDELTGSLTELPGPPYEAAVAFQRAIDAGRKIVALDLGRSRDITRPEDVITANFPYLSS
jgi:N-acetyl-alpha-D-muramate 1-phosphate uridylyltransferase